MLKTVLLDSLMAPSLETWELLDAPLPAVAAVGSVAAMAAVNPVGDNGDHAMLADVARSTYKLDGTGIKVGILSDSFNVRGGYAADIRSGALASGVTVLKDGPAGGADEGRAMAELVHKVAPGAQIAFYSAFNGETDFAAGILALAKAGCTVIVDDVSYLDEPFFQDGNVIQKAVTQVVASGVNYFTSASNEGTNFYQHAFAGVKLALPGVTGSYLVQNFGTSANPSGTESLTIAKGSSVSLDLQWDQPFANIGKGHASADSLGMVLYDAGGHVVAAAMQNETGGNPSQILQFTNTTGAATFKLAIITNGGSVAPGLFKFIAYGQGTTINDPNAGIGSGTVAGHELVAGANTVGAIAANNTQANGGSSVIEGFSSVGPGTLLFDVGGNRLAAPIVENKVNFVAPDGVTTSVFSTFYGTSAAAPDAAAVAALMLQANKALTPAQVSSMLAGSAIKVSGPAGSTGAGLIQATTAVKSALAGRAAGATLTKAVTSIAPSSTSWGTQGFSSGVKSGGAVASALAGLAADPTAAADFVAQIDPAIAAALPAAPAYGQSFAMVNSVGAMVVPIMTDQTPPI